MTQFTCKTAASTALGVALSFALSSAASNAELTLKDRTVAAVRKLQPILTEKEADRLATALVAVKDRCVVPWQVLLSIAFTESSLKRHAVGKMNPRTRDYGLMQINSKTVTRMGLDRARLMTDERYALDAACSVLNDMKIRYAKRHPYWIGLYRAGTAVWNPVTVKIAKDYHGLIMARASKLGYRR